MKNNRTKGEEIRVYMSLAQKNQLRRLAENSQKTMSEYVLNAALSTTLDHARIDFYQNINNDLLHLKKFQYVATRLLLIGGSKWVESDNKIMEIFNECLVDADSKFDRE